MAHTYQCGHGACRKRYHFAKALENYARTPQGVTQGGLCGSCGKGLLHETKKHIRKWNRQFNVCYCGAIAFPHREGSTAYIEGEKRVCAFANDDEIAKQFSESYGGHD